MVGRRNDSTDKLLNSPPDHMDTLSKAGERVAQIRVLKKVCLATRRPDYYTARYARAE